MNYPLSQNEIIITQTPKLDFISTTTFLVIPLQGLPVCGGQARLGAAGFCLRRTPSDHFTSSHATAFLPIY